MKRVKTIGIRQLKDNLSAFLREVKMGVVFLITDRGEVMAELSPAQPGRKSEVQSENPVWDEWLARGIARPRLRKKGKLGKPPLSLPAGTWKVLLDEERGT